MRKFLCMLIAIIMVVGVMQITALTSFADGDTSSSQGNEPVTITNGSYSLTVNKTQFDVGEPIIVSGVGSGKDWIGIYDTRGSGSIRYDYITTHGSGVAFDIKQSIISYGQSSLSDIPEGEYIIRLMPNDQTNFGTAKALIKIRVGNPPAISGDASRLSLEKRVFSVGEPIMVSAVGSGKDWVGIVSSGATGSSKYHYVSDVGSGEAYDVLQGGKFSAGSYIVALVPNDGSYSKSELIAYTNIIITDDYNYAIEFDEVTDPDEGGTIDPVIPPSGSVSVSNDTHSMSVNKTKFEVGEEILVTAQGVGAKDWIGIAQRGTRESTIRWYYITTAGNGVAYDIKKAPNIGGNLSSLADIPEGLYTIYLIENDAYLKNTYTFSINISVGNVEDSENGVTDGGTSEEAPNTILPPQSVEYTPSKNGYASGTISVTVAGDQLSNRSIVMYWADANGRLNGYTSLARFKVTGKTTQFTFTDSMVIPEGATRLLVYAQATSTGELSEEYISVDLPSGSDMKEEEAINSFFIISDIHIGRSGSAENFKKMLNQAILLNPNGTAIFIVGDMADNGTEAQFAQMMSLHDEVMKAAGKDASKFPLFLTLGNHDYPAMSSVFLKYATLPDGTHPTDTSYDFWLNGYHYIFLGSDTSSGLYANLTDETLSWLDTKLSECRDISRPTFVFLHQPMYNTVSGSLPGEGWNGVSNENALRAVFSKYPEVMFFNGHTHWTMDSKGNIFEGTQELPIKIFNCASVSYLWSGYNIVTGENLNGSQGYYIEMYDGKVFVRGRDFIEGKWIASAQYLIELETSENDGHSYTEYSIAYENGYMNSGKLIYKCTGCGAVKEEKAPALFTCLGYSTPENGRGGIAIGYTVNNEAIKKYEKATGKTLKYGVFAVLKDRLGDNDVFAEDGTVAEGVINAEISSYQFASFELKITGFETEEHMSAKLAMGAYVIDNGKISYMQGGTPAENESYFFVSYNDINSSSEA